MTRHGDALLKRRMRCQGDGERADDGVAGSRHVENIACGGGNVERGRAVAEARHAECAARDEDCGALQQVREVTAGFEKAWLVVDFAEGESFGLVTIGLHESGAEAGSDVQAFWIDENGNASRSAHGDSLLRNAHGQHALAVVGQNAGIGFGQIPFEPRQHGILLRGGDRRSDFAVEPNDLLVLGEDPHFHGRWAASIGQQRIGVDASRHQSLVEIRCLSVLANHADDERAATKGSDVGSDVGGTAGDIERVRNSTTGTGASGEIRLTSPTIYSSRITSPKTNTVLPGAGQDLLNGEFAGRVWVEHRRHSGRSCLRLSIRVLLRLNPANEIGCRGAGDQRQEFEAAAIGVDGGGLGNRLTVRWGVVGALAMNVGL